MFDNCGRYDMSVIYNLILPVYFTSARLLQLDPFK